VAVRQIGFGEFEILTHCQELIADLLPQAIELLDVAHAVFLRDDGIQDSLEAVPGFHDYRRFLELTLSLTVECPAI
jgi:hypothetical protein